GVQVIWDGSHVVDVKIPDDMKTKMCGICGDANGDKANDWTIGESDFTLNEFGFSWTYAIDEDDASCKETCPNPPEVDVCPDVQTQLAEAHCKPLTDPTGLFKDCLSKMEEDEKKILLDSCVYDSCHLNDFETVICTQMAAMARTCQSTYEVTVAWRSAVFCPMECGEGMEYKPCGNICMPTCSDRKGVNCGDTDGCEEGCFCKEGMVFDGVGTCFSEVECGCQLPDQGNVYINVSRSCSPAFPLF
ncbi:hypothetical protein CAPTEDRAFT_141748, partial [Capitella teleta]